MLKLYSSNYFTFAWGEAGELVWAKLGAVEGDDAVAECGESATNLAVAALR